MTFALALVFLVSMIWDAVDTSDATAFVARVQDNLGSDIVVLSLAANGDRAEIPIAAVHGPESTIQADGLETCDATALVALSRLAPPAAGNEPDAPPVISPIGDDIFSFARNASINGSAGRSGVMPSARIKILSNFTPAYRSMLKVAAFLGLPRIQSEAALNNSVILGTISTYNPYRDGIEEGSTQTASGELYDPSAWTAAVQIDLRDQFGGVHYGKLYQPTFALVENGERQVIVRINDVGRLKPGRVLDLNERSMRYFDPFLSRGLIENVRVTLLPGDGWTPGPVGAVQLMSLASTTD
jgi:peptidoglycan lytic transglycosylase